MCINLANEQLHQLFTQYIFKLEIQESLEENIGMNDFVGYQDNQIILDLFLDVRTWPSENNGSFVLRLIHFY